MGIYDEIKSILKDKAVRFATLPEKRLVFIGHSYEEARKKDLETIRHFLMLSDFGYTESLDYDKEQWKEALELLQSSLEEPMKEGLSRDKQEKLNEQGTIRYDSGSRTIVVQGILVSKNKKNNEEENIITLTKPSVEVAKNLIKRHYLLVGRWRSFKFALPSNVSVNADTIEL